MLTNQFKMTIGIIFLVSVLAIILGSQIKMQKDIADLKMRPVAVEPAKEVLSVVSPTATPSATVIPFRKVLPTK